jgi:tetratricopeptide (TPR) repeat protein
VGKRGVRKPQNPVIKSRVSAASWLPIALIALIATVSYANSLRGPFIFDDRDTILENRSIDDLGNLGAVLSPPHETPVAGRPFVNLTFAMNVAANGRDVTGFHAVNIAIHVACALLLFGVARRAFGGTELLAPAAIAALWAAHPLNSEAVNYITQRTELLMALCLMLTLYASVRGWRLLAVIACALGMASKESMVVAPLLVAAFDRAFVYSSWRAAWSARAKFYLALAATWLVLAWLVAGGGRTESAGFTAFDADAWTYLLNQAGIIVRYLRLAVWPAGFAIDYGVPQALTMSAVWPFALVILALLAATIVALRRAPKLGFLGLWFFLVLAPSSSIVPIPTEVGAERRMYLALMAVIALLVIAAWRWVSDRRVFVSVVALIALALAATTWARNAEYESALTLTETTVARYPTAASESMYGTELAAAGRLMEAETHLRRATSGYPPAHFYLATVLSARGDAAGAIAEFKTFIDSQPPQLAQVKTARMLVADLLEKSGQWTDARAQYDALLALYPADVNVLARLNRLGVALISAGRVDEAISAFQRIVDLAPDRTGAKDNLARALALRGK